MNVLMVFLGLHCWCRCWVTNPVGRLNTSFTGRVPAFHLGFRCPSFALAFLRLAPDPLALRPRMGRVSATDRAGTRRRLFAGRSGVGERGLFPDRAEASTEDWRPCPTASDKRLGRRGGGGEGEGEEGGGGGGVSMARTRYLT